MEYFYIARGFIDIDQFMAGILYNKASPYSFFSRILKGRILGWNF